MGLEAIMSSRVDMLDCDYSALGGLNWILTLFKVGLGFEFGQFYNCEWKNYSFDRAIARVGLLDDVVKWWSYALLPESCIVKKQTTADDNFYEPFFDPSVLIE